MLENCGIFSECLENCRKLVNNLEHSKDLPGYCSKVQNMQVQSRKFQDRLSNIPELDIVMK